ncbi:hypothetical protein DPMN_009404 [Dreissena polymorpha]|uniref:Uncharacterized protein n=1 Tax=Dreissena polymorpha TaxID=45954 RepID=A0A9D4MZJ4_DREPO|nr:hypothetical protein DPMN_009404 [Dreissena polymorpha]
MLSAYCSKNQTSWDSLLPQVMMAYRATPHSTTSLSPNVMVFGRNVVLPCELATGVAEKSAQTIEEYSLQQRMNIEKSA